MSVEQKTAYIALPERDDLVFAADLRESLLDAEITLPDDMGSYILRLIRPQLEAFAQEGWVLDEDRLNALIPDVKMIDRWFRKPEFRCKGVTVYLRRVASYRVSSQSRPVQERQQAPMSAERKTEYIRLPERDDLIFESDASSPIVKIPPNLASYALQMIRPQLLQLSQQGWEVDKDAPQGIMLFDLQKVSSGGFLSGTNKFRCRGLTIYLRKQVLSWTPPQNAPMQQQQTSRPTPGGNQGVKSTYQKADQVMFALSKKLKTDSSQLAAVVILSGFATEGIDGIYRVAHSFLPPVINEIRNFPVVQLWLEMALMIHLAFYFYTKDSGDQVTKKVAVLSARLGEDVVDDALGKATSLASAWKWETSQGHKRQADDIERLSLRSTDVLEKIRQLNEGM